MKYTVRLGNEEHEVVLDGDGVHLDGALVSASLTDIEGASRAVVTLGDRVYPVEVRRGGVRGAYTIWISGHRFELDALDERSHAIRELAKASAAVAGPAPLVAPMPGLIVRVAVQPGDAVRPGQSLVVMEAMKMENELRAHAAATVKTVLVTAGMAVEKGTVLVELS